MSEHSGVGVVDSVENKPKKAGGYFQVVKWTMDGSQYPTNFAYWGTDDIMSTISKRIEMSWEEKPSNDGQYTNRSIKTFSLLPNAIQPPASASMANPTGVASPAAGIDQRQENINRQSAWKEAVGLVTVGVAHGYNIVQGDSKKAKAANKDPELLFEHAKYLARKIKDDVQNGDWGMTPEEHDKVEDISEEELPF